MRTMAIIAAVSAVMLTAAARPGAGPYLHISSHLAEDAQVQIDGGKAVRAPGYGSVKVRIAAGKHILKVTSAAGVAYQSGLVLELPNLMRDKGKGYWCVNLMESSFELYGPENCAEDVTDGG
jgi:hypothetical protein